ncbi:uncharacterized protein METZ01_LOCUS94790, partial [marine metagenome]
MSASPKPNHYLDPYLWIRRPIDRSPSQR